MIRNYKSQAWIDRAKSRPGGVPLVITRDKDLPPTQTPATQAELADDDVDVEAMVTRTRQRRSPRARRMSARARQFAAMRDLSPSPSNEESVDKSM